MFKKRLQWYHLFVKIAILLFIGLLFDCSLVFRAICMAQSVFAMLTKNSFKKMGGGVRMAFILYFHQSHAWIWFKIVLWKSKKSIQMCRTFLQKNSNVLTVIVSWMACCSCQFNTKESRNLVTLILVHIFLWVNDGNGTTLFKWSFQT